MNKLCLMTALLAVPVMAFADGNTATVTTSGAAITVVSPIQVTRTADLSFGTLVVDPSTFTSGVLTIGTDNLINITKLGRGTWTYTGTGHQKPSSAQFKVTGEEGYCYGFVAAEFSLLHPSGDSMKFSPLVSMVDKVTHGTVPATVGVGGTLILAGKPRPGVWSGTFSVTAIYL